MSDEQTMDWLCHAASAEFSPVIVQKIREMELNLNDLMNLKREDINSEFDDLRFTQRKKLWLFFERQQESLGRRTFNDNPEPPRQKNLAANRPSEASHTAPPPYSHSPESRRGYMPTGRVPTTFSGGRFPLMQNIAKQNLSPSPPSSVPNGNRGGGTNVHVGQVTRSNVAGGSITSTTYNTQQNVEHGTPPTGQRSTGRNLRSNAASRHEGETPPKKNKYNIKMDRAQGVAIGDNSKVQGNKFNSRN